MIHRIKDKTPDVGRASFIAWNAEVAGEVTLGADVSVWFGASIRADIAPVTIGDGSNVQDNVSVHVDADKPVTIGRGVTIGHNAVVHGCTIGDGCLIGMGAVILSGAELGPDCLVGAGALVTAGKKFPARSLILGSPAKEAGTVTDGQLAHMRKNAEEYVELGREAVTEYREAGGEPPEGGKTRA
jgi:carbonic anhydrase/acetyltransferase-like protein (isoleucine patch superfamily)